MSMRSFAGDNDESERVIGAVRLRGKRLDAL